MASYLPPTEDVPIFDNSNFKQNLATLTYNDATKGFLTFPFAQGNETFQDITVEGTTDLINVAQAHYTMPPSNDASLIIPSTTWVQSAIANAPSNTDIDVTTATTAGPYYMPMITGSTTGAYTGYVDNGMSYDATTHNLSTTTFTGALVGNSSSATQVAITPNGNNATHYLTFSDSNTASNISLHTNAGILVNPSTDTITATTFSGSLSGNATSATSATTASVATTSTISAISTNVDYYPTYVLNQSGNNSLGTDSNFRYNPQTNNLTSNTFTGSLVGNASSATTANTATSATTATTATVATTTTVSNTVNSALGNTYIPLLTSISGNLGLNTAVTNTPRYNAITGQFTAQVFVGSLTGSATDSNNAQNVSLTTGDDSAGNWYIPYSKTTANDVNRLYIDNITTPLTYNPSVGTLSASIFSGALTGNADTATLATTATTATQSNSVNITNTSSSINYFLPLITNTTTGYKNLFGGGSISFNPAINTLSTTNFSASGNMQAPLIQTTANGIIRTYDTGGVLATSFQQSGTDLNITIPATGEMKITTQGTGVIPTSNADAGTSFLWNVSAGGGESCIVNYQDGGNAGGFDFYNVNGVANSVKIATIPKTQSPNGTASTTILPTYTWVNGTISDAISAIPALNSFNMTAINPVASNTYYGLWANSATTGSHPINNGTYVQLVPNTNTMSISSNLNILNTQTSLNNVRMTSTPIILAFGNSDGSAGGGADAVNLTSSYISSTGWTNPSAGLYTITLTGVAHSIFSATITGNPGTSTAGQRPQILTSVAYAGGFTNAYLSVTFQIYYLQGTGGAGAPFNGPFSYSISGIMN